MIMWLNHLFIDSPIDFEKRCRNRVWIGVLFLVLGAAALSLSFVARDRGMVMYLEPGYTDSGVLLGDRGRACGGRHHFHYQECEVPEESGAGKETENL